MTQDEAIDQVVECLRELLGDAVIARNPIGEAVQILENRKRCICADGDFRPCPVHNWKWAKEGQSNDGGS